MIDTERVIDTYIDAFGNEIDVYEQQYRYTVFYDGYLFYGDTEGYNEHGYDSWEDAIALYDCYGDMIHIRDNKYEVTFQYDEWY